jgi:hypothetical protein
MRSLLVIDNFAPDPEAIRERVVASEFGTVTGPDGMEYTGISLQGNLGLLPLLSAAVGFEVDPVMSFCRLNLDKELPNTAVHADTICAEYASILYLNTDDQCHGGTGFWRHKPTGLYAMPDTMPPDEEQEMVKQWQEQSFWQLAGFVGMRFNRLIVYPTKMFHSRYPLEAFGNNPQNGRLIWLCFFNRK